MILFGPPAGDPCLRQPLPSLRLTKLRKDDVRHGKALHRPETPRMPQRNTTPGRMSLGRPTR
jgi:hypothetical protein